MKNMNEMNYKELSEAIVVELDKLSKGENVDFDLIDTIKAEMHSRHEWLARLV